MAYILKSLLQSTEQPIINKYQNYDLELEEGK